MKAGTSYELYVQDIYKAILRHEGIINVNVQHDIKIVGGSGVKRQVDIYWEFKAAGIKHKVVVECKDYESKIPMEKIDAFHSKVVDIGGCVGVFVTKNGYQSGAIDLAKNYGIQLQTIHPPTDQELKGRLRRIGIDIHFRSIVNIRFVFCVNERWAKSNNYNKRTLDGNTDEISIVSADETCTPVQSILNGLPRDQVGENFKKVLQFENAYIVFGNSRIKIDGIIIQYDVSESVEKREIWADDLIRAIVHNILEGDTQAVYTNGNVNEWEDCQSKSP